MFKFPKFLIFFLAVVASFVLYDQFLDRNEEYQTLRRIERNCRLDNYTNTNCNFYLRERIFNNHGNSYEEIVAKNHRKLLLYNVFVLCLIVQLFVVFATDELEVLISVISLLPLVFSLSSSNEAWLILCFAFFMPGLAYLFLHLKKLIFLKIPNWFT